MPLMVGVAGPALGAVVVIGFALCPMRLSVGLYCAGIVSMARLSPDAVMVWLPCVGGCALMRRVPCDGWLIGTELVLGRIATGPIVRPVERRLVVPEQTTTPERFRLMAEVWRRNMRPAWLRRAADLLGLPIEPLQRLGVGWSPEHRATSWPMRDAAGDVIGVRLRCPKTAKKWAVKGSRAGLIYPADLLEVERPERLLICEGPTDAAALLSIGFPVVGVPSAGGGRDLLVALCRRWLPAEVVIVADADGPGLLGAERLADALMIVAPVRIVSPRLAVRMRERGLSLVPIER